ncbi:hypothetical protein AB0873_29145 [Micromonospora sp. NPDC047707]|uniref:hypothetical protein n=1 Tax=Micromonospora sp. NPDC047707 TaxID=3154498 RepID=UPI003455955D
MEEREREQALLSALTTERSALQTAHTGTIMEANGRLTVFLSTLSAALIGLGLVVDRRSVMGPFLAAVLPILLTLGGFTFFRLVQTMTESDLLTLRIQEIRAWHRDQLMPQGGYFSRVAPREQDETKATWTAAGAKGRWWQFLFTAAAMVGAINALLLGTVVTIALTAVGVTPPVSVPAGVGITFLVFGAQLFYIQQHTPVFRPRANSS